MQLAETVESVRAVVAGWRRAGETVAVVPTMGSLHAGHLGLVDLAKRYADRVVATIFVNPLQFGPNEDFSRYPRALENDRTMLESSGADLLFHPTVETMYPPGFDTTVRAGKLAAALCGPFRPGHFDGVLTVVLKLFNAVGADVAVFGEKDFQQLRLIERMVEDLALPLRIVRAPTAREDDGLAMSSRNRYFDAPARAAATVLPAALDGAVRRARTPDATVATVTKPLEEALRGAAMSVDYVTVADEAGLVPADGAATVAAIARPRLFVAARHAGVRLIDNRSLVVEDGRS